MAQRLGNLGGISKLRIGLLEHKCRTEPQSSLQCLALAMFAGASMVKLGGRGPALPLSSSEVAQRPSCALPGPEWKDWGSSYTLHHWGIAHGDQSSQPPRNQPTPHSHQHSTSLRDVWTSGELPDLRTNNSPGRTDLPEHPCRSLKFQLYLPQQEFWLNPIVADGSWWLRAPKSRNIQKGLLKDLNLEVAWDFHWKLHHVLSCAHVWAVYPVPSSFYSWTPPKTPWFT